MKRIAVIGAGYWGQNLVRVFKKMDCLYAVCDLVEQPGPRWTPDYRDLLTDPKVDAVVIATPTKTHYKIARDALLAGKDVFVEKPMTFSLEESQELVDLSEEHQRILMVGYLLEYHPGADKLKEIVWSGEIGNVRCIHANRFSMGKFRPIDSIVRNLGSHDIVFTLSLLGEEPDRVVMTESSYITEGASDIAMVVLFFKDNVAAYIMSSRLYPVKDRKITVVGDKMMATLDDVAKKLVLNDYDGNQLYIVFDDVEPLDRECKHFIECIKTRAHPKTGGNIDVMVQKIIRRGIDV